MNIKLPIFLLCALLCVSVRMYSQENKKIASEKGDKAVELMDNGQIEESLALLEECRRLDPSNITYPYEIAYANYLKKDYNKAVTILTELIDHKDSFGRVFQLLGNSLDMGGKPDKAIQIYEQGIKRFPQSGELYLERGNMELIKKAYVNALAYYEKGIEQDPAFPSNYYWASKIYCNSVEEVWGMIYGEIFINLERNSNRTAEISKLLYDTYKSEIKITSDTSFSVSFSKSASIDVNALNAGQKVKLPFGMAAYEPLLSISLAGEKAIDINSLDRIRTRFVNQYYSHGSSTSYPNILFDYQRKVQTAGHLEAYNHWVLNKGDQEGFKSWLSVSKEKWDAFINWFTSNPLRVDHSARFFRNQY